MWVLFTHCRPSKLSGSFLKKWQNKKLYSLVLNIIPVGVSVPAGSANSFPKPRSKSVLLNSCITEFILKYILLGEWLFLMYNCKMCIYGSLIIRVFCHGFELRTSGMCCKETWLLLISHVFCLHLSKEKKCESVVGC